MSGLPGYAELRGLMHDRNVADVACPLCGPHCREPRNRSRPVLRLWSEPGFISYYCARCGEHGYVRQHQRVEIDAATRAAMLRARKAFAVHDAETAIKQHQKALWLWSVRQAIGGTPAEHYLRKVRAISCPLPPTLGFLPARGHYPPALIAAFGMAEEPEPGRLYLAEKGLAGVHLTRLRPDGSGKAEEPAKIMIGRSKGAPLILAPPNDLLGLILTEGIEDALSAHQATGLGAWAAGSASRLPALADQVPGHTDCVTVLADDDAAGRCHAPALVERLVQRGIHAELSVPGTEAP
ncbi:toprim domain-containing protein [Mesorhizobium qingshengii]|uniref:Toprim domain-containing protein n=1 Tax=Mesorhizobium qingshengii TaxID=1165689 RepID=A0ABT4QXU1_9HYPH|nr:toprim domain-containing protein [Mesorhizobium qingshengii]MCZ8546319.1 toprim domain-containing protein [Mesorhizobium qingshengii]